MSANDLEKLIRKAINHLVPFSSYSANDSVANRLAKTINKGITKFVPAHCDWVLFRSVRDTDNPSDLFSTR